MYQTTEVLAAVTAPAVAATVLPNTGVENSIVVAALATLSGLLVWGFMYQRANR